MAQELSEAPIQPIPLLNEIADTDAPAIADTATVTPPVQRTGRQGFLPITTNTFDRCFISVVCFVAIHLLWMRFIEAFIPLIVATLISLVLAVIIVRWG
jgi:predicted small integral membrane protein